MEFDELLLLPHATRVANKTHNKSTQLHRRCQLRGLPPRSKSPASGKKATYIGAECQNPLGLCKEAELDGTVTASANGTPLPPGVTVGGVKVHVAPDGKELCKHDSVMG